MAVPYSLRENNLTTDPDLYAAQVIVTRSVDTEDIVDRILSRGSCVTKADCLAVLENAVEVVEDMLLEGARVNLGGLVDLYPRIRGKFQSVTDSYDPDRHSLDVGATCGARVRKNFRTYASAEKVITPKPAAVLLAYRDLISKQTNAEITPGQIASIEGKSLSYNEDKADEGIFFVTVGTGAEVKVPNTHVQRNKPGELVFANPEALVTATSYHLEVRSRPGGLKNELRVGRLSNQLMVP